MRLRRLAVQNFRGIKRCDWNVEPRLVALVGAGDATKTTTILSDPEHDVEPHPGP